MRILDGLRRSPALLLVIGTWLIGCSPAPGASDDADAAGEAADEDAAVAPDDSSLDAEARRDRPDTADAVPDAVTLPPVCGDGHVDPGEECDDGNRLNGDDCDWECRRAPGGFDYPDADPSVPPIEPEGPPAEIVPPAEAVSTAGARARSLEIEWGSANYGLAYVVDSPQFGLRFRTLERSGLPVGSGWSRDEPWAAPAVFLAWSGSRFNLFWWTGPRFPLRYAGLSADGHLVAGARDVLSPTAERPFLVVGDLAWNGLLHAALLGWCSPAWDPLTDPTADECYAALQLVSSTGERMTASRLDATYLPRDGAPVLAPLAGRFLLLDGRRAITFDPETSACLSTGTIPDGDRSPYRSLSTVVSWDDGAMLLWVAGPVGGGLPLDLWATTIDADGALSSPPRVILPAVMRYLPGGWDIRAAHGAAAIAVAYSVATGPVADTTQPSEVRTLNMDRWGNLRSSPTTVVSSEADGYDRGPFALAADDEGYGIVATVGHWWAGDERILFRRWVGTP
ncbi:MAG: hypothetical protein JXB32_19265 [Deltaproteobacteria bacterium]|nr:hypothetical protein [Deltaproteobacteria bacterium]